MKGQSPTVDSEVRRSPRVKEKNMGFKTNQCRVKNYLDCSTNPPTLPLESLKKIGTEFCQLNPDLLEEQLLAKKKDNLNKQEQGKEQQLCL